MRVFCSICREAFSPDSEVNVTSCGHLYHVNCLDKWSKEKTTCPQCRSRLWKRAERVEFLFTEIPDDRENLPYYKELTHCYEVIRQEENTLKMKHKELELVQTELKKKISECKREIKNSKFDIVFWTKQYNMYDEIQDIHSKLLKDNDEMAEKNNLLEKLNKLINGTEAEMYEILSLVSKNEYTIKELCIFVQAMKYKLKITENIYKDKLKDLKNHIEECETEGKTFVDKAVQTEPIAIKKIKRKLLRKVMKVR